MSKSVVCTLCPHGCELAEGERGHCRVRENRDGRLRLLVYGKPCAVHVDPIEKKPMFHVLPGSRSFSIATAGCNLRCKFCQNWEISQRPPEQTRNLDMPPEKVVALAGSEHCRSIAYTYSEPIIFYEYVHDTASLAQRQDLLNVLVTAGYINEQPLREWAPVIDAANVDLKGFDDGFYRRVCGGTLSPVLDTLAVLKEEQVFVEITTLLIPSLNDDMAMIERMCRWIGANLGAETPLHFSRFYPMYKLKNLPLTPVKTLLHARETALEAGLRHVYVGNVPGSGGENTVCPKCGKLLIARIGYRILRNEVRSGTCPDCGHPLAGIWSSDAGIIRKT